MDLSPYLETVRQGVTSAAALGDDNTRQVAERLGGAVESSTRLALINALSDAAAQVSAEVAPTSVELRISGGDPDLVVVLSGPSSEPTLLLPEPEPRPQLPEPDLDEAAADDEPVARISLRLPASVKAKVDEKADREGISTNAWLLRAVMDALGDRPAPPAPPVPPTPPGAPGEGGPFGPYGVFGLNGPFGPAGVFGGLGRRHANPPSSTPTRSGTVQGWVK